MRTGLTKQEKTTDIWFDEKDPLIHIRTHNTNLKKRLAAYAEQYPDECYQTDTDHETGCILNDLAASFDGRNEYISRLCSYPLLILDDFGMERGTEYGLEQVYSVIDSRYRSDKPLIATTNLTLEELQHPQDTPHARIYDRLTSMCAPVRFTGSNFRKETAQEKLERLKQLMKQRKESL